MYNIFFKICVPPVFLFFHNPPSNLHMFAIIVILHIFNNHVFVFFQEYIMPRFPRLPVVTLKTRPKQA